MDGGGEISITGTPGDGSLVNIGKVTLSASA